MRPTDSPMIQRLPMGFDPTARFREAEGQRLFYPAASALHRAAAFERPEGSFAARAFGNVVHRYLQVMAMRLESGASCDDLLAELPSWESQVDGEPARRGAATGAGDAREAARAGRALDERWAIRRADGSFAPCVGSERAGAYDAASAERTAAGGSHVSCGRCAAGRQVRAASGSWTSRRASRVRGRMRRLGRRRWRSIASSWRRMRRCAGRFRRENFRFGWAVLSAGAAADSLGSVAPAEAAAVAIYFVRSRSSVAGAAFALFAGDVGVGDEANGVLADRAA